MAITTNAQLETAVANWLHRADLTSLIPDFIMLGETRIYREVRTKDMETAFSDTIASGVIALPSSYIDLKFAYINTQPVQWLDRKPAIWIYQKYPTRSGDGMPVTIAREGGNFIFGPYPSGAYTVSGVYYKNLGAVSSSAHALFTTNPDLYLFSALAEAEPYLKNDARVALWKAKYNELRDQVNQFADNEDHSGSNLRITVA